MDFVLLVLKLCPIQVVIWLPLWIKLAMGQLLLLSLWNFCSFFSYIIVVLVTNLFSLLLIDRYILDIQQIVTHEELLWYCFWSLTNFLLNLPFIFKNLSYCFAWNTVVMFGLACPISTLICWKLRAMCVRLLFLLLLPLLNPFDWSSKGS